MSNNNPSIREQVSKLAFEQPLPGDPIIPIVRSMVLQNEATREGVVPWIDAVFSEMEDGQRMVFVARFHRILAGYMILKPRDNKISSIWVDKKFRGWGLGAKFYGMGVVNLGLNSPYTAFMPDMLDEMRPLAVSYSLTIDDYSSPCVMNPNDSDAWAKQLKAAVQATPAQPAPRPSISNTANQAMRAVRNKLSNYQA